MVLFIWQIISTLNSGNHQTLLSLPDDELETYIYIYIYIYICIYTHTHTHIHIHIHTYIYIYIQGVSRLEDITAGGYFLDLFDQ